ncbi:MAG TPA: PQQ-dependent sugar dehydrogenase [Candidatus Dormibacteraeota bacterium]|nr:PQQ-dependent sugar dehydrogenase [Candidatus Dormibacteraeota bacterium]
MTQFARIAAGAIGAALLAAATRAPALDVVLSPFATGFTRPVVVTNAGDSRLFVVEKAGFIRVVQSDGTVVATPFLDIHTLVSGGNEQGLLGLAFHPNYGSNGFFYVDYTDTVGDTQVVRYTVSGDPDVANPGSATSLLSVAQPFDNHNGGDLHFGPDGFLYISLGDGGSGCDPNDNAQDGASLLGKLLRIDVDSGSPYAIPGSNPYAGPDGIADEIWALGLRNPWRFSFDRTTGDLWIGDVGQNAHEEVDVQAAASSGGQNYGWDCREGFSSATDSGCSTTATCMPLSLFTEPVYDYDHGSGCSITGGFRYRGSASPALAGVYIFSDYCAGELRGLTTSDGGATWNEQSLGTPVPSLFPTTFGEDVNGELYVASDGGTVYRLQAAADAPPCPASPSAGCVTADKAKLNAKQTGDPSRNKLLWKWSLASSSADPGDPTAGTSYRLCLYAGTASVALSVGVPGGGSAWKATGSGFKYKDAAASGDGAFKMLLKGSSGGKSTLLLKAKGGNLDLSALPLGLTAEPLVTQLIRNDDPTCWEATFPTLKTDDGSVLKAKLP